MAKDDGKLHPSQARVLRIAEDDKPPKGYVEDDPRSQPQVDRGSDQPTSAEQQMLDDAMAKIKADDEKSYDHEKPPQIPDAIKDQPPLQGSFSVKPDGGVRFTPALMPTTPPTVAPQQSVPVSSSGSWPDKPKDDGGWKPSEPAVVKPEDSPKKYPSVADEPPRIPVAKITDVSTPQSQDQIRGRDNDQAQNTAEASVLSAINLKLDLILSMLSPSSKNNPIIADAEKKRVTLG